MHNYTEPARSVRISGSFDVVVVGGGIAGVAAAIAAARSGASVCVIEKQYALGGLATLGLVVIYLPICDGNGRQVCGGLAEELLWLAAQDGAATVPSCWHQGGDPDARTRTRYAVEFNPTSYLLAVEQCLLGLGVTLLYDTRCCAAIGEDRVDALVVENKGGRSAVECRAVVDCTGDADVCALVGEPTTSLRTNVAAGWYYSLIDGKPRLHKISEPFDAAGASVLPGARRGFAGEDEWDVTAQIVASRSMIREHQSELRKEHPDASVLPFLVPTYPGFRMTRRLVAPVEFSAVDGKEYDDSVGLISDWRRRGPVYSVPLRAIRAVRHSNLFVAGRCISATGTGWDQTRVIPPCVVTGEAAGTACAMIATGQTLADTRGVHALQDRLRDGGSRLFLKDIEGLQ